MGGRESEGLTACTNPEDRGGGGTAARTSQWKCYGDVLAVAQQLEYYVIAVSTAVLGQSHKDNVRCTAAE